MLVAEAVDAYRDAAGEEAFGDLDELDHRFAQVGSSPGSNPFASHMSAPAPIRRSPSRRVRRCSCAGDVA
jgi:hypothetical protein